MLSEVRCVQEPVETVTLPSNQLTPIEQLLAEEQQAATRATAKKAKKQRHKAKKQQQQHDHEQQQQHMQLQQQHQNEQQQQHMQLQQEHQGEQQQLNTQEADMPKQQSVQQLRLQQQGLHQSQQEQLPKQQEPKHTDAVDAADASLTELFTSAPQLLAGNTSTTGNQLQSADSTVQESPVLAVQCTMRASPDSHDSLQDLFCCPLSKVRPAYEICRA